MKDKSTAMLLAFFLGGLGAHQYYLGNTKKGIIYTVFCITFIPGIVALFDLFVIASTSTDDFNRKFNAAFMEEVTPDYGKLNDLHSLKEKGVISEEEFLREKQKLIA
jgi:TM2 domain-containing membrane protein YozV